MSGTAGIQALPLGFSAYRGKWTDYKILCYYTNWSQHRPGESKFLPEDIDPRLCTHMLYAFAKISGGVLAPTEINDLADNGDSSKGLYTRVIALKKINPHLKVLLSVGGWEQSSDAFTQVVATEHARSKFIRHAVGFLRHYGFDGLDLDWEYPGARGSPAGDRLRYTQLLKEARAMFEQDAVKTNQTRLLLSAAVPAGRSTVDNGYEIANISWLLDFVSLMAYDLHGSWDSNTGMHSALYPRQGDPYLNQDWAVQYWIKRGCPPQKLILGIGAYGRTFTLSSSRQYGLGAPVQGAGQRGKYTGEAGFLSYYEICDKLRSGWSRRWHGQQRGPYAYGEGQWVGYEDQASVILKGRYVMKHSLGGVMVWSLDLDDFKGTLCDQGTYPILKTLYDLLK